MGNLNKILALIFLITGIILFWFENTHWISIILFWCIPFLIFTELKKATIHAVTNAHKSYKNNLRLFLIMSAFLFIVAGYFFIVKIYVAGIAFIVFSGILIAYYFWMLKNPPIQL